MRQKIAKAWVEALRSGKYEQGKNRLCKDGKYCCLGVLCEVAIEQGLDLKRKDIGGMIHYGTSEEEGNTAMLPVEVLVWAEMRTGYGDYDNGEGALSSDNDRGKSFEEIAAIIEEKWSNV